QLNLLNLAYDSSSNHLHILASDNYYRYTVNELTTQQTAQPSISVIGHTLNGTALSTGNLVFSLPRAESNLFIEVSVPYFNNITGYHLLYNVNNTGWVNNNWNTGINVSELRYGHNQVQVKIEDEMNRRVVAGLLLSYNVQTPFWRTTRALIVFFLLALAIATIAMWAIWKYINQKKILRLKKQQRQAELEHKVLSNMLNPHFMNNAINSIQSFVIHNNQRKTLSYLSKFARLMQVNLELLDKNMVPLEKELQNTALYLEFEKLRNPDILSYNIQVQEQVNTEKLIVPPLLIQPFVENAIWHGILPKKSMGTVTIQVNALHKGIEISIADDGIGRAAAARNKKQLALQKQSKGLQIITDRLELLNATHPGHYYTISDNTPQGTVVVIRIPC
ncbi:MAG: histidine kinase, partial [Dinghuibacter sp.]|nr:histidine kinase [Dinghuibacter sp.]